MRRDLIDESVLDPSLHYVFDWDLWIRLSESHKFHYLHDSLAMFRVYDESKTGSGWMKFIHEHRKALKKYGDLEGYSYARLWINSYVFLIRYFYHNRLRVRLMEILERGLGTRSFERLRKLKRRSLPFLSREK
jgi:hypothetical protein